MQNRERDPRQIIRNWGALATEVAPLVCPILLLIRSAAATDPDMARLLAETDQQRLQRMSHSAHAFRGHLQPGITRSEAAEVAGQQVVQDWWASWFALRKRWSPGVARRAGLPPAH